MDLDAIERIADSHAWMLGPETCRQLVAEVRLLRAAGDEHDAQTCNCPRGCCKPGGETHCIHGIRLYVPCVTCKEEHDAAEGSR
jgi:hypothetical protein